MKWGNDYSKHIFLIQCPVQLTQIFVTLKLYLRKSLDWENGKGLILAKYLLIIGLTKIDKFEFKKCFNEIVGNFSSILGCA